LSIVARYSKCPDLVLLYLFMPPPLIGGAIKRCFCLTSDVCLSVCRVRRA